MDITSYLLGKKSSSGGGGGGGSVIDQYFNTTLTQNTGVGLSAGEWALLVKKLPPIETDVSSLFQLFGNFKGAEIDLSKINGSNITNMGSMFNGCSNLVELTLPNWNTSNNTSTAYMFNSCTKLKKINISNLTGESLTNTSNMFYGCSALEEIDMRNLTFTNVTSSSSMFSSVPRNCKIIVKSQTEKDWVLSVRSALQNVVIAE